jgi:succinate-acetate transporter protein
MGSVTAPENIRWFLPVWGWFALAVWVGLRKSSPQVLFVTFLFVFFASAVPFFCRALGCFASDYLVGFCPPSVPPS